MFFFKLENNYNELNNVLLPFGVEMGPVCGVVLWSAATANSPHF